jgi:hypothetical protein
MSLFEPKATKFTGRVVAAAPVDRIFPLFSPVGEKGWVPGWSPELLHPKGVEWAEGQIFRTSEEKGEAVWIVSRLDRDAHRAEYHRVEPGRYVARVDVACRPMDPGKTEATIAYTFVGLSEGGNAEIEAMNVVDYERKMSRWSGWIDAFLNGRTPEA